MAGARTALRALLLLAPLCGVVGFLPPALTPRVKLAQRRSLKDAGSGGYVSAQRRGPRVAMTIAGKPAATDKGRYVPASELEAACADVRAQFNEEYREIMDELLTPCPGELGPVRVEFSGELPADLPGGALLRIGPNGRPGSKAAFFDEDGMVHCLVLPPPKERERGIWYSRTWVRTAGFEKEEKQGQFFEGTIGQAPRGWPMMMGMLKNMVKGAQVTKDTCNTALSYHGGKILALMEQCRPSELSVSRTGEVKTLKSLSDLEGAIPRAPLTGGALAAHHRIDPETGERLSLTYDMQASNVRLDTFKRCGSLKQQRTIPTPLPVMVHDLAITQNYAVLLDLPLTFRQERVMFDRFPIEYEPSAGARIGLIPRAGGEMRSFAVRPCVVLHAINAHEREGGNVVVVHGLRSEPTGPTSFLTSISPAFPYEWVLDLRTGACVREGPLSGVPAEFPTVSPARVGREAASAYALRLGPVGRVKSFEGRSEMGLYPAVVRYSLAGRGGGDEYSLPHGSFFVSEPTVVPRAGGGGGDDDGYLLLFASAAGGGTKLLVLDANDLSAGPLAEVPLPAPVPTGLHSEWVPWGGLGEA